MSTSSTDLSQVVDAGWDLDADPIGPPATSTEPPAPNGIASDPIRLARLAPLSAPPPESEEEMALDAGWESETAEDRDGPPERQKGELRGPRAIANGAPQRTQTFSKKELHDLQRYQRANAAKKRAERKASRAAERRAARAAGQQMAEQQKAGPSPPRRPEEQHAERKKVRPQVSVYDQVLRKEGPGQKDGSSAEPLRRKGPSSQPLAHAREARAEARRIGRSAPARPWIWVALGVALLAIPVAVWLHFRQ